MKRSADTNQTNAFVKKVKHVNPQDDGAKDQTSTTAQRQVDNNAMPKSMPNPSWQQTMLRIKDPKKSLKFYVDVMGMTLIDKLDFPSMKFSLYFLTTLPIEEKYPYSPGTPEANAYLWSMKGVTLELTHNWDSEEKYHIGNEERDGFGHIAFACDDVYKSCEMLEKKKISFKKKPDEGRMKGLAFALDPDGYWVEIVSRVKEDCSHLPEFCLAQTMIRVKDPVKSIAFYTQVCGMTLLSERHFKTFSLYFLATVDGNAPDNAKKFYNQGPVLELTHNHGTENKEDFVHFNGNEKGRRGFGHIGFLVDDVYKASAALEANGVKFKKKPDAGKMKGLAFALDPDGYWIEIIPRGMTLKKKKDGTFHFISKNHSNSSTDENGLRWRSCAGACIFNSKGQILVGERIQIPGSWQTPQGGVDPGENTAQAAAREAYEECGLVEGKDIELVGTFETPTRYKAGGWLKANGYVGQEMRWALFRCINEGGNLDASTMCNLNGLSGEEAEFSKVKWATMIEIIKGIWKPKQPVYQALSDWAMPLISGSNKSITIEKKFDQYTQNGEIARQIAAVIPYYPFKGIPKFYDIGGFLSKPAIFQKVVDVFVARYRNFKFDSIFGFDARGFVIGPPIALALKKPFYMLRKKGKMPNAITGQKYTKEYAGDDALCIQRNCVNEGDKVLLVDDLVATGGTLCAGIELIKLFKGTVVECACIVEIKALNARKKFKDKGHAEVPIWGLISEDVLTLKGELPEDYVDDGENHG